MPAALLADRGVLSVTGADAGELLGRLLTSAVDRVGPGQARFSSLLTPQGKVIADFIVVPTKGGYLIDAASDRIEVLAQQLTRFRLRAQVVIADRSEDLAVLAIWGDTPAPAEAMPDPRLPGMGARAVLPREEAAERADASEADYHRGRIILGVPEGGKDFLFGETFPHEADLDQLGGIDFDKGCYVGQEIVSRMQHRGTARSRIVPVHVEGEAPPPFEQVFAGERAIGTMGSSDGMHGLALLRLDRVGEAIEAGLPITSGSATLTVQRPDWASFAVPGAVAA